MQQNSRSWPNNAALNLIWEHFLEAALTSWWSALAAAELGPAPGLRCPGDASGWCQPADRWPRRPRPGSGTWRTPFAAVGWWPGWPRSSELWRDAPAVSPLPRELQTSLGKEKGQKTLKYLWINCVPRLPDLAFSMYCVNRSPQVAHTFFPQQKWVEGHVVDAEVEEALPGHSALPAAAGVERHQFLRGREAEVPLELQQCIPELLRILLLSRLASSSLLCNETLQGTQSVVTTSDSRILVRFCYIFFKSIKGPL